MKLILLLILMLALPGYGCHQKSKGDHATGDPAGHWEGSITLPATAWPASGKARSSQVPSLNCDWSWPIT